MGLSRVIRRIGARISGTRSTFTCDGPVQRFDLNPPRDGWAGWIEIQIADKAWKHGVQRRYFLMQQWDGMPEVEVPIVP